MMTALPCPDENELVRFTRGDLGPEHSAPVETHLDACASCRRVVAAVALASGASAGAPPPAHPRGAQLGRYRVERVLGSGAMGVVYAAHDPQLDRQVALKGLRQDLAGGEAARARVMREAQAMARLSHPNVVSVFDISDANGELFVAMELSRGLTLDAWLRAAPRSRAEILSVFLEAGRGLAAAHRAGVVHRDFKPQNVLVDQEGRVRVSDFGLARTDAWRDEPLPAPIPEGPVTLTRTGILVGTPRYMSPEQFEGRADARSDQFSFCVALYEALAGAPPFTGATVGELRASLSSGRPPVRPDELPEPLFRLLLRGLSRDPADRFEDMEALVAALGAARPGPAPRLRRRKVVAALLGVGLLAGALAGGLVLLSPGAQPAPGEEAVLPLRVGEQRVLKIPGVRRIAVGDPSIVDVKTLGEDQILVTGMGQGKTTLLVWSTEQARRSWLISVR